MDSYENQIEKVMKSAFSSLKEIVDVNTVIGNPYTSIDGTVIVPISKVTLAFLSGGGEYSAGEKSVDSIRKPNFPMSAGSGGYVQLTPVGFLVGRGETLSTMMIKDGEGAGEKLIKSVADYISKAANNEKK